MIEQDSPLFSTINAITSYGPWNIDTSSSLAAQAASAVSFDYSEDISFVLHSTKPGKALTTFFSSENDYFVAWLAYILVFGTYGALVFARREIDD